jgi:ribokinase
VDGTRVAVVGHVEWLEFARVERVPATGEIVHASSSWEQPAGGGAVVAVQLQKLAGEVSFFTALGEDELGHRAHRELQAMGVRVEAVFRGGPQRRAFTFIDDEGERTITVIGERLGPASEDPLPWSDLAQADAVYFTAGDVGALRAARQARLLVATLRVLPLLVSAGVELDAVVGSGRDPAERYPPGAVEPPPRLVVRTAGAQGGSYETAGGRKGTYPPAPVPGWVVDSYGCGDSFAGGLTFALGAGLGVEDALGLAARCGAACLTGRGAYEGQLRLEPDPGARPIPPDR